MRVLFFFLTGADGDDGWRRRLLEKMAVRQVVEAGGEDAWSRHVLTTAGGDVS